MLGGLSLVLGISMVAERDELLQQGRQTVGVVVGIHIGVKGLRSVEAEYVALDGRRRVGRDLHSTQWYDANEIGEEVWLYYDPFDESDGVSVILIERGAWIWSNPVFLIGGGLFLLWLGFFLVRQERGKPQA